MGLHIFCLKGVLPTDSTKKDPQPKLRIFFGGSWWIRKPRPKNAPLGHFCPAGRNRGARAVRIHQRNSGKIEKYKKRDTSFEVSRFWWELVDSNHRSIKQQIYSLSPLATRESSHIHLLPRAHSLYRSVLDYYSKAAPEMQAFFSIFLRFFQKSLFQTLLRVKTCKRRAPRRGRAGRCKGVFGFGVSEKNRNLYVMASQPCWLSGLDRAIALAWSKAQWL